ncbi:MAG: DUF1269 domain-containing protein [Ardenticatenaceae bacterium]|nr:DUF1269 domain-containing protein [Ardenticatenaceae bacterium]
METNIVAVTFTEMDGAEKLLKTVHGLVKENLVELDDAVVVVKNEVGKLKVKETTDLTKGKGAAKGGTLGFVVGLLLGGPIGGALLGAAAGALLARKVDLGIPKDKIDMVTAELSPGSSLLFVQGRSHQEGIFRSALAQSGGKLYDLQLTEQAVVEVENLSTTRDYY